MNIETHFDKTLLVIETIGINQYLKLANLARIERESYPPCFIFQAAELKVRNDVGKTIFTVPVNVYKFAVRAINPLPVSRISIHRLRVRANFSDEPTLPSSSQDDLAVHSVRDAKLWQRKHHLYLQRFGP